MAREGTQQIEAAIRGLERVTEQVVAKITIDVHREVVKRTPVDTGWARANWVPRVGAPQRETVGERPRTSTRRGRRRARGRGVSDARGESAAGLAAVLAYRLNQGFVFITNNVFYIRFLNDGHSPQAPAGFVQQAIAHAVRDRRFRITVEDV